MKIKSNYLAIIFFVFTLFSTSGGYSQNILQGEPGMDIREMAKEASNMWSTELGLTEKQEILMEKKFIEFGMKKEDLLQSKMQEEAKAKRLLALQEEENADMRDILTRLQHKRYLILQEERLKKQLKKDGKLKS
ncbi:hypothetical protein BH23BAC2_BH23BAC2_22940 [soil metagenome]